MTGEQYHFAVVHGAVVSAVLGRRNADWMRGHAETSVTGKWDAGFARTGRSTSTGCAEVVAGLGDRGDLRRRWQALPL